MTAFEDEHGTYIMNSKICALSNTLSSAKMGVHSLKIEVVLNLSIIAHRTDGMYRRAIDDAVAGKPSIQHC